MPYQIIEVTEPWQVEATDEILRRQYTYHGIPWEPSVWLRNGLATRIMIERDEKPVGSIDIIRDGELIGLPAGRYYREEVNAIRERHKLVYEVGSFATDRLHELELMDLLGNVAKRLDDGDGDIAICGINPHRNGRLFENERVYGIFMGWKREGKPRYLPGTTVPVILMVLTRAAFRGSVLGRRVKLKRPEI